MSATFLQSRLPTPLDRAKRAYDVVRARGGSAMDAALASIDAGFDGASITWRHKQTVRDRLRCGPGDTQNRIRFGWFFDEVQHRGLDAGRALALLEFTARNSRRVASAIVLSDRGRRLSDGHYRILRLALRYMRRHAGAAWPLVVEAMTVPPPHRVTFEFASEAA